VHREHHHQSTDDRRKRDQHAQKNSETWNRTLDAGENVTSELNVVPGQFLINPFCDRDRIRCWFGLNQNVCAFAWGFQRFLKGRER
jgi:hypothetical protein